MFLSLIVVYSGAPSDVMPYVVGLWLHTVTSMGLFGESVSCLLGINKYFYIQRVYSSMRYVATIRIILPCMTVVGSLSASAGFRRL